MGGRARLALIPMVAAAALSGCMVGPDFRAPAAPDVAGYTSAPLTEPTSSAPTRGGEPQRFVQALDIPGDWWTLFRSKELNRLIEQALRDNPDFDAAQFALREAKENVSAARGTLFPSVTAGIQSERERLAGAVIGQPQFTPTFSVTTASLDVSYAADVLGGTRRQLEMLGAQAEYQQFALEATYLTLTSNLVVTAIQEASLRARIAATEQILTIEGSELELIRERFRVGVVSQAEVLLQEATLYQTRATLPPLQKQLARVRNELTALAGRLPSQQVGETFDLDSLSLPQQLPVSLPSQLIEQRPDVRGAEAQLHAACAAVGIAMANQLPQFSISAGLGRTLTGFPLFPGAGVWSVAGGVEQSLFDAGTLRHKEHAAVAALDQAAARYRSTVITAFQNVSDALQALQSDADDLAAQQAAERSAHSSLELARRQLHAQTVDYLTVLSAERTWQRAYLDRVQAESNRYADTAALFQALGGGWWHRTDVSPGTGSSPPATAE